MDCSPDYSFSLFCLDVHETAATLFWLKVFNPTCCEDRIRAKFKTVKCHHHWICAYSQHFHWELDQLPCRLCWAAAQEVMARPGKGHGQTFPTHGLIHLLTLGSWTILSHISRLWSTFPLFLSHLSLTVLLPLKLPWSPRNPRKELGCFFLFPIQSLHPCWWESMYSSVLEPIPATPEIWEEPPSLLEQIEAVGYGGVLWSGGGRPT